MQIDVTRFPFILQDVDRKVFFLMLQTNENIMEKTM
jgi:hypothetical protein